MVSECSRDCRLLMITQQKKFILTRLPITIPSSITRALQLVGSPDISSNYFNMFYQTYMKAICVTVYLFTAMIFHQQGQLHVTEFSLQATMNHTSTISVRKINGSSSTLLIRLHMSSDITGLIRRQISF